MINSCKNKEDSVSFLKRAMLFIKPIFKDIYKVLNIKFFIYLSIAILLFLLVLFLCFFIYPEGAARVINKISFGYMVTDDDIGTDDIGTVEGVDIINKTKKENNNYFDINNWSVSDFWLNNNSNSNCFTYDPNIDSGLEGGPKMVYLTQKTTDEFCMKLEFTPENNETKEINLFIKIGDLYKVFIGDGNNSHIYVEQNGNFVSEKNGADYNGIIELENKIRLKESVLVEIDQELLPDNSLDVRLYLYYFPDENYNSDRIMTDYSFRMRPKTVCASEENIIVGVSYSKTSQTVITTCFNDFILENR